MMNRRDLPDTDMTRLQIEILGGPLEGVLPVNMTDEWLNFIARDIYEVLSEEEPTVKTTGVMRIEAPFRLVARLLIERKGEAWHIEEIDALRGHFLNYLAEVTLELVRRQRGHWIPPASLDTILTRTELTLEQALYGVGNGRAVEGSPTAPLE